MFLRAHAVWDALFLAGVAVSGLVLSRTDAGIDAVLTPLLVLIGLTALAQVVFVVLAPVRIYRALVADHEQHRRQVQIAHEAAQLELQTELEAAQQELAGYEEGTPRLSFGKPDIPKQPQGITLPGETQDVRSALNPARTGRVIRVPVINARGAGEAKKVHARLTFGSGTRRSTRALRGVSGLRMARQRLTFRGMACRTCLMWSRCLTRLIRTPSNGPSKVAPPT